MNAAQPSSPAPSGDSDLAQLLASDEDEGWFYAEWIVCTCDCRLSAEQPNARQQVYV